MGDHSFWPIRIAKTTGSDWQEMGIRRCTGLSRFPAMGIFSTLPTLHCNFKCMCSLEEGHVVVEVPDPLLRSF